ncbi:mannonate dehydratase [Catalinimonas alkaloidigena]|uniref:mannonate dehydratase n=1 Tax=Catalinimonas alkaloidigena TaxID=1075417 RepID=UPI002406DA5E|nr:mannonate dehydratase [Catalinimonas alkaloidigena]MDF9799488.1 mannonate dehydratase [Catalinimonas alkaloidigena]
MGSEQKLHSTQSKLFPTWRWFGPDDAVTLPEIRQVGAEGIVTALHHVPCGEVWSLEEISRRKEMIDNAGFRWSVVESVNIHESIKTAAPERDAYIEKYRQTLIHLSKCNIKTVCYNFMPVLDWTRTQLRHQLEDGSYALRYDPVALAAFELYILKRKEAEEIYTEEQKQNAYTYLQKLSESEKDSLQQTIMAGLPGTDEVFTPQEFMGHLERYKDIDEQQLRENLTYFLSKIIPVADEYDINMCIHPDDPPFPILGLPRVVRTEEDLKYILNSVPSMRNGITFCTGSLGARRDNDLPGIIQRLGDKIHFLHLRNVRHNLDGSFHEADHLAGNTDMFAVMKAVIEEQQKRLQSGREDVAIPMRPDHGHQFLFDADRKFYPGYSAVGRMRGLAELRGLELGIRRLIS